MYLLIYKILFKVCLFIYFITHLFTSFCFMIYLFIYSLRYLSNCKFINFIQ